MTFPFVIIFLFLLTMTFSSPFHLGESSLFLFTMTFSHPSYLWEGSLFLFAMTFSYPFSLMRRISISLNNDIFLSLLLMRRFLISLNDDIFCRCWIFSHDVMRWQQNTLWIWHLSRQQVYTFPVCHGNNIA